MIQKIISIKKIGRFNDCKAAGDVSFRKCNLIFAENGRGKTTFCSILRSLQTGEPAYILGRQTLGDTENPPEVEIRLDGDNAVFKNGSWNRQVPDLTIFDLTFVNRNVFSGDSVEIGHRKNLYNIIIGKKGVDLANQVNAIDKGIDEKNSELRSAKVAIQAQIPEGLMDVEAFLDLPEDKQYR